MRQILTTAGFLALAGLTATSHAQSAALPANLGFELNRYEPTAAGEWSFGVDHPWYSSMRYFAAGLTLNYAHNPLVVGVRNPAPGSEYSFVSPIIEHRLMGHLDLAGSFADRVLLSASLPVVLRESGNAANGVAPISGAAVGDIRLGARVRLFGQPYRGPVSLSLGLDVWIPLHSNRTSDPASEPQVGETQVRALPKLMLGGLTHRIMWSFTTGLLYRPVQSIGDVTPNSGNTVGSELQFGAAIKYADLERRFAIGPEALLSTVFVGKDVNTFFRRDFTSLEVLLGIHYNVARVVQLGVAGGIGLLREPGTPDGRFLFRLAYAPMPAPEPTDRDHDGIVDKEDACPAQPGVRTADRDTNGCPPPTLVDDDGDGVASPQDQCPSEPAGLHPDPLKPGCPLRDQDADGVFDKEDQCPTIAAGAHPDPSKPGCPLNDQDGDGVFDNEDQCLTIPAGAYPNPLRKGCPDQDSDKDGVYDGSDQCKDVPAGLNPDPTKLGCPLPDRDNDQVPDAVDACPDQPGSHSPDPKRNGCPGLIEIKGSQIVIREQVFFATGKDVILKKSFPLLDAIGHTLKSIALIKRLGVEGHTDNKGKEDLNIDLSDRRAKSVVKYLTEHGIAMERLEAKGYGPTRPIADNKTNKGRALNRRVDFKIIDPAQPESAASPPVPVKAIAPLVAPRGDKKTGKAGSAKHPGHPPKAIVAPAAPPAGAPADAATKPAKHKPKAVVAPAAPPAEAK